MLISHALPDGFRGRRRAANLFSVLFTADRIYGFAEPCCRMEKRPGR